MEIRHISFTGHRNRICRLEDLEALHTEYPGTIWIHGGAIGFDRQVEEYARAHKIITIVYRPEYEKFGASAPLRRNELIVNAGDILIACWDGRHTGGTWYTICYARGKGKDVHVLEAIDPTKISPR